MDEEIEKKMEEQLKKIKVSKENEEYSMLFSQAGTPMIALLETIDKFSEKINDREVYHKALTGSLFMILTSQTRDVDEAMHIIKELESAVIELDKFANK